MLKNWSIIALLTYIGRLVYFGASIGDALVVVALTAVVCLQAFLETKKQEPLNDTVRQELETLKSTVNALKLGRSLGK